jgi:hypothetical protein
MFFTLMPLVLSILGQLPELINIAEKAFGGKPGSGAAKKALVTDTVSAALTVYQSVASHPLPANHTAAILGAVSSLTDSTVQAINTAGLFIRPSPPAATDTLQN